MPPPLNVVVPGKPENVNFEIKRVFRGFGESASLLEARDRLTRNDRVLMRKTIAGAHP